MPPNDNLRCPECNQRFEPTRPDQVFCSPAHRRAWNNRQRKDAFQKQAAGSEPSLWTSAEVATFLGVTATTLRGWRARGCGPAFARLSPRIVRYRSSDVVAWVKAANVKL